MDIQQAIGHVVDGKHLHQEQMVAVMRQIMTGGATQAQIGGFLVAMRMKGETVDEITGAVMVMRELASGVTVSGNNLVDIVGTGGDGANIFNVSTASCFAVAVSGAQVVKHGNRSLSSKSGSADLLEAAGVAIGLAPHQVTRCVEDMGVGFMFAPAHHSAMKYAGAARKELGIRTLFNVLGPMTNPAGVKRQMIGVYDVKLCRLVAEVLKRLGSEHVLVVHSDDGLDEISLAAVTHVVELKGGDITEYDIAPEDFGINRQSLDGLRVAGAGDSLKLIRDALGKQQTGEGAKAADMIALNAGAAIYVSGVALNLAQGVAMAQDAIASGLAGEKLRELAAFTECMITDEQGEPR
ncbi:MAG: anthranilate phosphoribosyltransferase [Porticoccaceae bacterium]